ncbi:ABC transporter permease [Pseudohongiella spirulinae]|uniref:ABC-type antimicrobial peptide transport system n=1 Tax=Pseudohongiella spirulinae TaxID=1249552 RepID=A0A0S2KB60_9GAMM|nr:ABC transporter permease [Pseudohongiella spirulinae]ALO45397.1 ABC-type antimicrobial peptide transport system [Pseudohongiella spirulinae]
MFFKLAVSSLVARRLTVFLAVLSVFVSTFVVLGVEHIRQEARNSFNKTVAGVDLVVGARTGQINLLLYSVFRIGSATNNITWESYQDISASPGISWSVPIALGDSHRGYRVMGTTSDYFQHFRYGNNQSLVLNGTAFSDFRSTTDAQPVADFAAVLGSDVAVRLGYQHGHEFVIAHGIGATSFSQHDHHPFTVSGILAPTGTPVDQTIHVSLESLEAAHHSGPMPESVTAFMLGLESRLQTFSLQRDINNYPQEPLLAILPGVALSELWQLMNVAERTLSLIGGLIMASALLGIATMLLSTLQQRQREMLVLRALGARPAFIFLLIQAEALMMTVTGMLAAIATLTMGLALTADMISRQFGIFVSAQVLQAATLPYLTGMLLMTVILATIPAARAYRQSSIIKIND